MRPKSVAMTSMVLTTSVLPTSTWVVARPVKVEMVRLGPGGTIQSVGEAPLV